MCDMLKKRKFITLDMVIIIVFDMVMVMKYFILPLLT